MGCRWAPFAERLFLSASADGTARLWREESADPLLTFQSEDTQGEARICLPPPDAGPRPHMTPWLSCWLRPRHADAVCVASQLRFIAMQPSLNPRLRTLT